jgi:hypothetical protein
MKSLTDPRTLATLVCGALLGWSTATMQLGDVARAQGTVRGTGGQ